MRKMIGFVVVVALLAGFASSASADSVSFSTTGSGVETIQADVFDWAPGNTVIIQNADQTFTILYQANLGTIQSIDDPDYLNEGGPTQFTAVAGFTATGVSANNTTTFTLVNPEDSFFNIYADVGVGSDLAGTGFTDGTLILSGTATFDNFGSSFTVTDSSGTDILDQSTNGNQYVGVNTIEGVGSTKLTVVIDSYDSNYFLDLIAGQSLVFTNTSQILPYAQTDPSACFSLTGAGAACQPGAGTAAVGPVNGFSSSIVAQSDANSSFLQPDVEVVPEPASLLLLGSGLLGAAAARRRARKAQK